MTDQLLQQYESYEIVRYFDNIRPTAAMAADGSTPSAVRYADRYAEQLWDTLFAKAPEITLFSWPGMAALETLEPGEQGRVEAAADQLQLGRDGEVVQAAGRRERGAQLGPRRGLVAGADRHGARTSSASPIGVASYKPYQSSGEDFLHDYLGQHRHSDRADAGVSRPTPTRPAHRERQARSRHRGQDEEAARVRQERHGDVGIAEGPAGQGHKGHRRSRGRRAAWSRCATTSAASGRARAPASTIPAARQPAVLFPEIRFFTNDMWAVVRGVAGAKGFPIVLMNRYSKGIFYVLDGPGEHRGPLRPAPGRDQRHQGLPPAGLPGAHGLAGPGGPLRLRQRGVRGRILPARGCEGDGLRGGRSREGEERADRGGVQGAGPRPRAQRETPLPRQTRGSDQDPIRDHRPAAFLPGVCGRGIVIRLPQTSEGTSPVESDRPANAAGITAGAGGTALA